MRFVFPAIILLALGACAPQIPDSAAGVGFSGYDRYRANREAELAGPDGALAGANNPGISDEQSFAAVTERETIESDRERLAAQRAQYQVIAPTAVPKRAGVSGPNIVSYALSTRNEVGDSIYRRSSVFAQTRYQKNCAKFASPDLAQIAFLKAGGPKSDRKGIDPDGDGFACSWDPTPFRSARN